MGTAFMKKKIIIISVTMLLVGTLSTVSAIFLPKYMKHSFAIVASDGVGQKKSGETISNSEKPDNKKTESSQSVVSRKAQSEQSSDVSISGNKSATARTPRASRETEESHIEKVTKFYKPAIKIGCSSTDMEERMFYDGQIWGDTYFKTSRENHNLDRCRTQFKLVSDIEKQWDKMNDIVMREFKKGKEK